MNDTSRIDEIIRQMASLRAIYRESPLHQPVVAALDRLNRNMWSGGDRRIIVLIGEPGIGKSRTIHEALKTHASFKHAYRSFECPSPCTVGAMGAALLSQLGHSVTRENFRDHSLVSRIESVLPHSGVHIVLIDEAQHALNSASEMKLAGNRDFWKRVTQGAHPFGLVLSGTSRVKEVVLQDRQLSRRTIFVEGRRLVDGDAEDVEGLIGKYAADAALECQVTADLAVRVMHACAYTFGEVCKLIIAAVEDALIADAETLTINNFASAYAADTDCEPRENPFITSEWARLPIAGAVSTATPLDRLAVGRGGL
ncbi:MAG: ATP-binding protein [Phreatobacter sp.]|nr:ATP-binding protein [Phreatobacter sp.]